MSGEAGKITVEMTVNGEPRAVAVTPRRLLSDVLREDLALSLPLQDMDARRAETARILR